MQDIEPALTSDAIEEGHRIVEHLPDRPIMDYLVDFFVAEIAWFVSPGASTYRQDYTIGLSRAELTTRLCQVGPACRHSLVPGTISIVAQHRRSSEPHS